MLAKLMGLFLLGLIRVLTGAQARWIGCPPKAEQRIYFANHQSHADLVLIWAALPRDLRGLTRPIAARDYWTKTPFRQWITTRVFNAIYVSRERSANEDPLEPLAEALGKGDSIILFPEGTRAPRGGKGTYKSGAARLAIATGTPVQPVVLRFADRHGPFSTAAQFIGETTLKQSLWLLARGEGLVVHLTVLPPQGSEHADRRALSEYLRELIAAELAV